MRQIMSLPIGKHEGCQQSFSTEFIADADLENRWMYPGPTSYGYHIPMVDELRILVKAVTGIVTIISELAVLVIIANRLAPQKAEAEIFVTLGFCALFVIVIQPSNGTGGAGV